NGPVPAWKTSAAGHVSAPERARAAVARWPVLDIPFGVALAKSFARSFAEALAKPFARSLTEAFAKTFAKSSAHRSPSLPLPKSHLFRKPSQPHALQHGTHLRFLHRIPSLEITDTKAGVVLHEGGCFAARLFHPTDKRQSRDKHTPCRLISRVRPACLL